MFLRALERAVDEHAGGKPLDVIADWGRPGDSPREAHRLVRRYREYKDEEAWRDDAPFAERISELVDDLQSGDLEWFEFEFSTTDGETLRASTRRMSWLRTS